MRVWGLVAAATLVTARTSTAQLSVVVDGAERPVTSSALSSMKRDTATMVFHGSPPMRYEGLALADVLRSAGVRSDSLRGPALATRLVVEATDGFRIVLALAELDPSLGGRRVLLANRRDGKTLPPDEAPWRLIIVGDQRPSRSARQVVRIRVVAEPQ